MDKLRLHIIKRGDLDRMFELLRGGGYSLVGPTLCDGVIKYAEVRTLADLPVGCSDRQAPGSYEVQRNDDGRCFGYVPGADSWKLFLFPPKLRVFGVSRAAGPESALEIDVRKSDPPAYAFIGVRACEIAAIGLQDKAMRYELLDPYYRQARDKAFILAVNCTEPGGTCFCASMKTGPRVTRNFDLCLTELGEDFGIEVGSERGAALFRQLSSRPATAAEQELFRLLLERASERMGRHLETDGLADVLGRSLESPRWQTIASRCLACGNCTMVCPTCFCYNVVDGTDLTCRKAERWRYWDSCFTLEFSYLGATSVRSEISSRYRQWMTHKLAWWNDQFGASGCVGCGRCITWCPVGIDITAEAAAFREGVSPRAVPVTPQQKAMPS